MSIEFRPITTYLTSMVVLIGSVVTGIRIVSLEEPLEKQQLVSANKTSIATKIVNLILILFTSFKYPF